VAAFNVAWASSSLGVLAGALCQQRGMAHFMEQVESIVRRCTVGAQTEIQAAQLDIGHRRDTAGELEVGRGTVCNMAAFMSQQVDFSSVKMDGMNGDQLRPEQAKAAQPLNGAYAVLLQALLDLVACFVQMHMDWYFQLGGQGGRFARRSCRPRCMVRAEQGRNPTAGSLPRASRTASPFAR
jgi:hypothetical protein